MNRPHSISVEAVVPEGGADGVLFSIGGDDGGFAFYVQNGLLTYGYNYVAESHFRITSTAAIPSGHHFFSVEFTPTGPADMANGKGTPAAIKLFVDGQTMGEGHLPVTIPLSLSLSLGLGLASGAAVGADPGSPTMPDDKPPFAFTGTVKRALVDVTGTSVESQDEKMRMILARQ
jgi:arylsulfatase